MSQTKADENSVIGRGMDFPDVTLVLQVGLPADADAYTHRVGRTARAGKDGRAILLLTQQESFYLKVNPQFPIKPYPASEEILSGSAEGGGVGSAERVGDVNAALEAIDPDKKRQAYSAFLGFNKTFMKKLQLTPEGLVQMANTFALEGMMCDEVPEMEKKTVGYVQLRSLMFEHVQVWILTSRRSKMGLSGVKGINYATGTSGSGRGRGSPPRHNNKPAAEKAKTNSNNKKSQSQKAPAIKKQRRF